MVIEICLQENKKENSGDVGVILQSEKSMQSRGIKKWNKEVVN